MSHATMILIFDLCRNVGARQAIWKFDQISHRTDRAGLGTLKAKLDLASGPSPPNLVSAQFTCQDATLSGVEFELTGLGYRISLVKKQIFTGML